MFDVVIIGAGASGVMCALSIKEKNPKLEVLLLEKNNKIGKKLLITGNGKCNLGNASLSLDNYFSNDALNYLVKINKEYYQYLRRFGVVVKEGETLVYPYSMQALTVCKSFERSLEKLDVKIKYDYDVNKVIKTNDYFLINNDVKAKTLVVATGGKTYPKTGSTGKGYELLKAFGHYVTELYPSLTSLKTNSKYIKEIAGVRTNAHVRLIVDGKEIDDEKGQLQFTTDSLSGICVFNLSINVKRFLGEKKNVEIIVDLVPDYGEKYLYKIISLYDYKVEEALSCILNNKLASFIAKLTKFYGKKINNLSSDEITLLCKTIKNLKFNIIDTGDFDTAQVTMGGAILSEFSCGLESKFVKGLYAVGEVLDVTGRCGGYNLAWAFNSAITVANDIVNKQDM